MQEFLISAKNHSVKELMTILAYENKGQFSFSGTTLKKGFTVRTSMLNSQVDVYLRTDSKFLVVSGDRSYLRSIIYNRLIDIDKSENAFYSEAINEACFGTMFPSKEQLSEYFDDFQIPSIRTIEANVWLDERERLEEHGYFVYDLRDADCGDHGYCVECRVVCNNIGNLITDQDLTPYMHDGNWINDDELAAITGGEIPFKEIENHMRFSQNCKSGKPDTKRMKKVPSATEALKRVREKMEALDYPENFTDGSFLYHQSIEIVNDELKCILELEKEPEVGIER